MERAKLYALPGSHPCACVEEAMRLKGMEWDRVDLIPVMHKPVQKLLFGQPTVPGLQLDGERIVGSRRITRRLDQLEPEPPLFPADPARRAQVEELERWGEEVLQEVPRRIFRWAAARDYAVRRWLGADVARVPGAAIIARPSLQAKAFARASGADDAAVRADLAALPGHLDEVERLRSQGVIGGEQRNAADFQIAASLRSIEKFADLAPYVRDHPAVRWASTVLPALPGPVPPVIPREWLRPLEPLAA